MKSFPLAQSAAINCRRTEFQFDGMYMRVLRGNGISMARNEVGGASILCGCMDTRMDVCRMQDPQKQHVLPAPCDIDSYSFSPAKGALLSTSAAFTFCFIKFSPLRFVLRGLWKYEVYLTRHVRVYCIFLLLLFLLLLPLHIYAFVCRGNWLRKRGSSRSRRSSRIPTRGPISVTATAAMATERH